MQDPLQEKLIYEMLVRQNKLMIDRILPELERLTRVDSAQCERLIQLELSVKELTADYFERMKAKKAKPNVHPD